MQMEVCHARQDEAVAEIRQRQAGKSLRQRRKDTGAASLLANQIGICRNAEPLRRFTVDNVAVQHKRSHAIAPLVQNVIL